MEWELICSECIDQKWPETMRWAFDAIPDGGMCIDVDQKWRNEVERKLALFIIHWY